MKILIFILIFNVSINCFAQFETKHSQKQDNLNHFGAGFMIGSIGNCVGYEIFQNKTAGLITGIVLSSTAGYLKEKYDEKNGKIFNKSDFTSTVYGGITGSVTIRFVLWNSIHRKKCTMQQYFEAEQKF